MKKLALAIGLAAAVLTAGTAQADQRCRQVQLDITNETGQTIRVFRLRYHDIEDAMMRTNDISNTDILNGATETISETLEYVGNEQIGFVSVQYRIGTSGPRQWSAATQSEVDRCARFTRIAHTVTGPGF